MLDAGLWLRARLERQGYDSAEATARLLAETGSTFGTDARLFDGEESAA